ncbi:O-antigen ligase like membrane protein [Dyadobacter soli]|uniref:O-antigen ligase like membrane protein n=1 Tax=Dyadobacter soli TaxID=659014 RepID=A0A1G7ZFG6_9BACT|nr:O-antigen ligase family protein [Dyadobacter soli]SDH07365.1 O-antigen ligase like membrane protein [Dyadobacter soli]
MVRLIVATGKKAILSVSIAWIATTLCSSLLMFGESTVQTVLVFGFYIYCILTLAIPSDYGLFHVVSIPALSQFLHLFQKYDFPAGANSLWRLLPFILVDLRMLSALIRFKTGLTSTEKSIVASWFALNFVFIIISPNLSGIITGAFTLILFTIPLYFLYLGVLSKLPSFAGDMERSLCLIFILLVLGTFGLVYFGAQYKGASNLLVTRNISDTNVTMAYFILLWPFAMLYASRTRYILLLTLVMFLLFVSIVVLSFSRGAVLIVLPYLLASLLVTGNWKYAFCLAAIAVFLSTISLDFIHADLAYSWQLRFADFQTAGPVLQKIQEASGRSEIRRLAYELFLESPLYGHGTGSFEVLGPGYREAHSMFFTVLAEQGLIGVLYMYGLFVILGSHLFKIVACEWRYRLLPVALATYLLFVHTVGFVFVIIPAKSLTINCIAPVLLICIYYYSKSIANKSAPSDHG